MSRSCPRSLSKPWQAAQQKGFRETAWFKAGEIEEELAKAQAAQATEDPLAPSGSTGVMTSVDPSKLELSRAGSPTLIAQDRPIRK